MHTKTTEPVELYRSDALLVRHVPSGDTSVGVVTFDSFTDYQKLDRPGFGQAFLAERGVGAVHVISRENDWYQYDEMAEAAAAIRSAMQAYDRVATYGSSMGGYAAFRFAGLLGADAFIALSPQVTIDPSVVPFERRWLDDAKRLNFIWDHLAPEPGCRGYVFYDPHDDDARHVALMARQCSVIPVRLRHAGHPSSTFLLETGLLSRVILDLIRGSADVPAIELAARRARRRSPKYLATLAHQMPERRMHTKIGLLRAALALSPQDAGYASELAEAFAAAGRFEEAGEMHRRALALDGSHPILRHRYAWHLLHSENHDEADALSAALVAEAPNRAIFVEQRRVIERHKAARVGRQTSIIATAPRPQARAASRAASLVQRIAAALSGRRVGGLDGETGGGLSEEGLRAMLTTTPAPPQFVEAWARDAMLRNRAGAARPDLVLLGDSLVEHWPEGTFSGRDVFNFGVAADRTQHLLWRLRAPEIAAFSPRHAVILIGTNNLASGDEPEAITAGIVAVARAIERLWPATSILAVEIPPCGPTFAFNARQRFVANLGIRAKLQTLNVDQEMTDGFDRRTPNYHPDRIHFSAEGYRLLTRLVAARLDLIKEGAARQP
ncbi:hypothetical protein ASE63_07835 [Bosea sp. Root381]|uniref:GDSL-type esterase/lipase family protein n=1 Tax=Bosea sp. Root381 TaxID=1736524 RepID=UPI0006FD40B1|nr:GDSL-type esterase/lipase family protein [Bosea sp. Root381]KRE02262.1 hypothetical protein ASE63_07835 [Bosea sp. Root381]